MFEIQRATRDDDMAEAVIVVKDGRQVGRITTQADCPEDNSCSRLDVAAFARELLVAAGIPEGQIAHTDGEY